jgi:murein L,D-transpeptidase YafK
MFVFLQRLMTVFVLLVVVGAVVLFALPDRRQQLDRLWVNLTREANSFRYRTGRPLPGTPDLARLDERLQAKGVQHGAPVFLRIFKLESELELWMEKDERYVLFATYPVCRWSGRLGPKFKEGDAQAPEGFYAVSKEQLNPNSRWHRSFNLGYPNEFDRAHGRTGSFLMVHGGCQSIGCFAMTNGVVDEIWRLVTAALDGGQTRFPVHVFPFRMTGRNVDARKAYVWSGFWADLKTGHDLFEANRIPPVISVCDGRYAFEPGRIETVSRPVAVRCPPALARNP